MSTLGDLSINAKITVSEDTAYRCIQLLNIYLADNPRTTVEQINSIDLDGNSCKSVMLVHHLKEGEKHE